MQCNEECKDFNSVDNHLRINIIVLKTTNYKNSSACKSLLEFYEKHLILNNIFNNEEVNAIIKNDL